MKVLGAKCETLSRVVTFFVTLGSIGLTAKTVTGADFSFSYNHVFALGADTYLVDQQNVRKYSEWQSPPVTYWGPSLNDVPASLTYRFDFPELTLNVFLHAELASFNFVWGNAHGYSGSGTGSSSLWASTDDSNWQLLLDNPMPTSWVDSYMTYSQNIPASLLGSASLWIQARMQVSGAPNSSYTVAQFSRSDTTNPNNFFAIDVTVVPEPSTFALVAGALGCLLAVKRRRNGK